MTAGSIDGLNIMPASARLAAAGVGVGLVGGAASGAVATRSSWWIGGSEVAEAWEAVVEVPC